MKRIFALLLVISLCFALWGCGQNGLLRRKSLLPKKFATEGADAAGGSLNYLAPDVYEELPQPETAVTVAPWTDEYNLPPSDNNQEIIGMWYDPETIDQDDYGKISVRTITFSEYGYYYPDYLVLRSANPPFLGPDAGLGSYEFATLGDRVYLLDVYDELYHDENNMPSVWSMAFSIDGDTLSLEGTSYYRTTEDQLAQLLVEKYYG